VPAALRGTVVGSLVGLPGNPVMAVMLGAFPLHGVPPGAVLFARRPAAVAAGAHGAAAGAVCHRVARRLAVAARAGRLNALRSSGARPVLDHPLPLRAVRCEARHLRRPSVRGCRTEPTAPADPRGGELKYRCRS